MSTQNRINKTEIIEAWVKLKWNMIEIKIGERDDLGHPDPKVHHRGNTLQPYFLLPRFSCPSLFLALCFLCLKSEGEGEYL